MAPKHDIHLFPNEQLYQKLLSLRGNEPKWNDKFKDNLLQCIELGLDTLSIVAEKQRQIQDLTLKIEVENKQTYCNINSIFIIIIKKITAQKIYMDKELQQVIQENTSLQQQLADSHKERSLQQQLADSHTRSGFFLKMEGEIYIYTTWPNRL